MCWLELSEITGIGGGLGVDSFDGRPVPMDFEKGLCRSFAVGQNYFRAWVGREYGTLWAVFFLRRGGGLNSVLPVRLRRC